MKTLKEIRPNDEAEIGNEVIFDALETIDAKLSTLLEIAAQTPEERLVHKKRVEALERARARVSEQTAEEDR